MSYGDRSAERARLLARLADELLAQHEARKARTSRNVIPPQLQQGAKPAASEPEQTEHDAAVRELLRRLAIKDRGAT